MAKISLASLSMRIKRKHARSGDYLRFGELDGGISLMAVWRQFLDSLQQEHSHDEAAKALLTVSRLEGDESSAWGTVRAGDYGYTSDLINVQTGHRAYSRTVSDAEMLPFYFLVDAPDHANKGILLLQRHGGRGVQTLLLRMFREFCEVHIPQYLVVFSPQVPGAVVRYLLEGHLQQLTLISYRVPTDLADRVHLQGNLEDSAIVKTVIKARRNRFLPKPQWMRDVLADGARLFEYGAAQPEIADEIQITVNYNGNQRTVDLRRPDRMHPYVDCTEEVELDQGHPVFESINRYAQQLRNDLAAEMGR